VWSGSPIHFQATVGGIPHRLRGRAASLKMRAAARELSSRGAGQIKLTKPAIGALCYIVPGTSFWRVKWTAREYQNARFSGCRAACFGIQMGWIG
jgi:hypothetical protein